MSVVLLRGHLSGDVLSSYCGELTKQGTSPIAGLLLSCPFLPPAPQHALDTCSCVGYGVGLTPSHVYFQLIPGVRRCSYG